LLFDFAVRDREQLACKFIEARKFALLILPGRTRQIDARLVHLHSDLRSECRAVVCKSQISKLVAVMILVYGDDSADEKRERVSAVAVVIGSEQMWAWLEPQWIARTDGIPFHARDCESDEGDYKGIPHKQNKGLYKDLTTMLSLSDLCGLGVAIDHIAQRQVFPLSMELAYYKAFTKLMEVVRNVACRFGKSAKFTFDIGTENEYNAGLLYSIVREDDPEMLQRFNPEISFVSAKYSPRLQAADLLAYEAMKALDHTVGPNKRRRNSWDVLRATERFDALAYGTDWFQGLKANLGELEQKVGFNQQDYLKWLSERNRQHNMSNVFHFMNWIAKRDRAKGV